MPHVLGDFHKAEQPWLEAMLNACADALPFAIAGEDERYQGEVLRLAPAPKFSPRQAAASGERPIAALPSDAGLRYRSAVTRSQAESWSTARSLAFLAATFAIVFGSLLPFAALAASTPGHPMVICSTEGPQTIAIGVDGGSVARQGHGRGQVRRLRPGLRRRPARSAALQPAAGRHDAPGLRLRGPAPGRPAARARTARPPSTAPPQA